MEKGNVPVVRLHLGRLSPTHLTCWQRVCFPFGRSFLRLGRDFLTNRWKQPHAPLQWQARSLCADRSSLLCYCHYNTGPSPSRSPSFQLAPESSLSNICTLSRETDRVGASPCYCLCVTETTPVPAFAATTSTTGPSAGLASTSGHLSPASHYSASYRHVGYVSLRLSRGSCLSTVLTCKQPSKAIGIRQDSNNVKYCATPIDSRFVSSAKCCPISVLSTEHSTLASHPPFVLPPWRPFLSKKRWISDRAH